MVSIENVNCMKGDSWPGPREVCDQRWEGDVLGDKSTRPELSPVE